MIRKIYQSIVHTFVQIVEIPGDVNMTVAAQGTPRKVNLFKYSINLIKYVPHGQYTNLWIYK